MMETRAGYMAVGLAAILSVVLFCALILFSVNKKGGGRATYYQIEFEGGVSGLSVGNEVRFNGIRVGEVHRIEINDHNAALVRVVVAVGADVPISDDAEASLEPVGITGRSVVSISGGASDAKPLAAEGGQMPSIKSKKSGLNSLLQKAPHLLDSADDLLRKSAGVFSYENEENLRRILSSLAEVSAGLEQSGQELRVAIDNFNKTSTYLQKMLESDVRPSLVSFQRFFLRLNEVLEQSAPGVQRLSTSGVDELQRALSEANTLLRSLNLLTQRINADPRRFLFGDTVPDYRGK